MESAVQKRAPIRALVSKTVKEAAKLLNSAEAQAKVDNEEEFVIVLEKIALFIVRLEALATELKTANDVVAASFDWANAKASEEEYKTIADFEDKILECLVRLKYRKQAIENLSSDIDQPRDIATKSEGKPQANDQMPARHASVHAAKLQKIALRQFDGDAKQWLAFWEQFKEMVHENPTLPAVEKFYYLSSALKGKATEATSGFHPSGSFYDAAIELLKDEFGDPERLVEQHMNNLMSLPPVKSRFDAQELRSLYNLVSTNTRALESLGVPFKSYSIMLRTY